MQENAATPLTFAAAYEPPVGQRNKTCLLLLLPLNEAPSAEKSTFSDLTRPLWRKKVNYICDMLSGAPCTPWQEPTMCFLDFSLQAEELRDELKSSSELASGDIARRVWLKSPEDCTKSEAFKRLT